MENNKTKGNFGEELACEYISKNGLKIIERNWRFGKAGEIDIIAMDKNTLAFIEVKARTTKFFGHPLEAITAHKIKQMQMVAQAYINQSEVKAKGYRFDAISVILTNPPEIEHLKDIWQF